MPRTAASQVFEIEAKRKYDVTFINNVGGTEALPIGKYQVRVTSRFFDPETGGRMIGELVSPEAVKLATKVGTTPYPTKVENWNPAKVYFSSRLIKRA